MPQGPADVRVPPLGESAEGIVTRWLRQQGDTVNVGDALVEVESEKASVEIPAPATGVLTQIVADEGATVPVAGQLGIISPAAPP